MAEQKFPSEVIDLPSEGKLYPEGHPLKDGKIEIKYMTAKEEDILTSQNLIQKGLVVDKLLDSWIITEGVTCDDLVLGDKNAVMVAARVLAYGPDYECQIIHPTTNKPLTQTFNLAECPFKKCPEGTTENKFEVDLPISKKKVTFKVLTGKEDKLIDEELKASEKVGAMVVPELTTRLRYAITSVDGDSSQNVITNFVQNLLARDSMHLRKIMRETTPDIELQQKIELGGEFVKVDIPMTAAFFWPDI